MRGSTSIAILATFAIQVGATGTEVPCVTAPTPCPCCADGACYPKRDTWGYYTGRWRKWPGDDRPDIPGRELDMPPGQLPPGVGPVEVPGKIDEDRRAPLSAREREERAAGPRVDGGAEGPPLAEPPAGAGPPGPGGPAGLPEAPPQGAPQQNGGFEFDPPPQVPFGQPPADGFDFEAEEGFQFPSNGPGSRLQFDSDLPPALPRGLSPQHYQSTLANKNPAGASTVARRQNVVQLPYLNGQDQHNEGNSHVTPATSVQPRHSRRVSQQHVGRAVFLNPTTTIER